VTNRGRLGNLIACPMSAKATPAIREPKTAWRKRIEERMAFVSQTAGKLQRRAAAGRKAA